MDRYLCCWTRKNKRDSKSDKEYNTDIPNSFPMSSHDVFFWKVYRLHHQCTQQIKDAHRDAIDEMMLSKALDRCE